MTFFSYWWQIKKAGAVFIPFSDYSRSHPFSSVGHHIVDRATSFWSRSNNMLTVPIERGENTGLASFSCFLALHLTFPEKPLSVCQVVLVCGGLHTAWPSAAAGSLLQTHTADSWGCAAQTHQALTDETCSPQWQGTLEMSPSARVTVNTGTQSHPHTLSDSACQ